MKLSNNIKIKMLMFVESFLVQQMAYCSDKCFSLLYDINLSQLPNEFAIIAISFQRQ